MHSTWDAHNVSTSPLCDAESSLNLINNPLAPAGCPCRRRGCFVPDVNRQGDTQQRARDTSHRSPCLRSLQLVAAVFPVTLRTNDLQRGTKKSIGYAVFYSWQRGAEFLKLFACRLQRVQDRTTSARNISNAHWAPQLIAPATKLSEMLYWILPIHPSARVPCRKRFRSQTR